MNIIKLYLSISLLLILSMGCRKENIKTETQVTPPIPEVYIESTVFGLVADQFGNPIEDAEVRWGAANTLTDQNGYFKLKSNVPEYIAVLNIKKDNYFETNQTLSPTRQETVRTKVQLTERTLTGSISSSSGGSIEVNGGGKVDFAPGSFQDESGNPYSGDVYIYTKYLDPKRSDLQQVMPGNLTAYNADGEPNLLYNFGMVNVELESSTGQKLQINQAATLTIPVPASLLGSAPTNIPLWHFDTESGLWQEDGEAVLQGNEYIGAVNHFSWWGCFISGGAIHLSGHVITTPVQSSVAIRITRPNGESRINTTLNDGGFSGYVPKNELLTFEILDICNEVIFSQEIGPFSQFFQSIVVNIDLPQMGLTTFSGAAINCDGQPVSNGYVLLNGIDDNLEILIPIGNNGSFITGFYPCGVETISVSVVDIDEGVQNTPMLLNVQQNMNLGTVNTCEMDAPGIQILLADGTEEAFFGNCTTTLTQNNLGNPVYNISAQSVQDGGIVNYTLSIQDENNNPSNPSFSFVYDLNTSGSPEVRYSAILALTPDAIVKLSSNELPGDLVHFVINDALISKTVIDFGNGNVTDYTFVDNTIEIKATLTQ